MPTWYYGAIKFQQTDDSATPDTTKGLPSLVTKTEAYLFDAVSYTDAEAKLYAHIADNTPDFEITALRPMRLSDVFEHPTGDGWYKCKTHYMTEDDKGRAKKVTNTMLINASSLREANTRLEENLSSMLVPVVITDINLTPILEVVKHEAVAVTATVEDPEEVLA